jgi:peptidyl-prolyl cis-trans isomerase SurA
MKPIVSLLAAALCAVAMPALAAPQLLDRIIAVVNDAVILQSDLDRAMTQGRQQIRERGIAPPSDEVLRAQVMERLILVRLQTQRAQEGGIKVDDRELNEVMSNIAAQNKMTLAEFAREVQKEGQDYLAVREQIRDEVLMQRLRAKEVEGRVLVTDEDVDLFLANEGKAPDAEYRLSHILVAVPDGAPTDTRDKARKKADAVHKKLQDGADFAQTAIASSDGQQALEGGDLGWRKADALPELFAQQLPKLKEGELSPVLETASGFHLVKLVGKRSTGARSQQSETRAQHILLQANAIRDEEQTKAQARDLYEQLKKGADFAELAKKFSDDPGSKGAGGDLGWTPTGAFTPDFQKEIDKLKPGEIAPPFTSTFGWHIAKVLDRRTRDITDESRRQKARQAIQNRKMAEEYESWLRKLREEAYVEYRLDKSGNKNEKAGSGQKDDAKEEPKAGAASS